MLCVRCHSDHPHPSNFKHTIRPSMIIPKNFPLDDGAITCTTCHDPHLSIEKSKKTSRLRKGFSCKLCHVNL
ncbi:MAG: hypothetical protein HY934_01255 [Candidatus Firestonebacteria bacterium]|nr:hypothetical protein [Candidatus Firestonebacteria bacterium]